MSDVMIPDPGSSQQVLHLAIEEIRGKIGGKIANFATQIHG